MKLFRLPLYFFFILVITLGCNTLYHTNIVDIEVVEPGKIKIPTKYKNVAIRYNNCNVAPNPFFKKSYQNNEILIDTTNLDSIASKIYYQYFVDELGMQNFFDSIVVIEDYDYSKLRIVDTIQHQINRFNDSILSNDQFDEELNVFLFSKFIAEYHTENNDSFSIKYLHPKLGLYEIKDLENIADSTNTELLISLDYFSSLDGIFYDKNTTLAKEIVLTQAYWNFYDLKNQEYLLFYNQKDTISWEVYSGEYRIKKALPPQKDAVLNAADIAGTQFAQYLVPHWNPVQRMYYTSGHIDLKKTDQLVKDGKWLEAAEIWKANSNSPNKSIAAKCKFNMGLTCEIQGNLDAALEWVVESYHVFGQKNMVHSKNCMDYIRIISQRKVDKKILDRQFELIN